MSVELPPHVRGTVLEIRRLHIASGDGRSSTLSTVLCQARRRSVSLESCLRCGGAGGLVQDPAARASYVSCRSKSRLGRGPAGGTLFEPPAPSVADRTPVWKLMTTQVVAVRPDVTLESLTALFLERSIGGAAVVDALGRPIGMVSKTDLLRERYEDGDTGEGMALPSVPCDPLGSGFHAERLSRSVSEVMTRSVFTLSEGASVSEAAALMSFENVRRVPVVSADGRVVGMLASLDILRWLAQQDGYLLPVRLRSR